MRELPLPNSNVKAIVDNDLADLLSRFPWVLNHRGYVSCWLNGVFLYMHQLVIGKPPAGFVTDHRNRIKHDNQRENLRHVTHAQNMQNRKRGSSQYLGVFKPTGRDYFRGRIKKAGVIYHLGNFTSEIDAARAYDKKALELFGDSATLNFPDPVLEKIAVK